MPPRTPVVVTSALLCACVVQAPERPTEPPAAPRVRVEQAEAPPFDLTVADPLAGCREAAIDPTVTWSCGSHTVVLATYDKGLPPDTAGTFRGGDPTQSTLDLIVGERTHTARVLAQPILPDSPRLITVLVRDEAEGRVASCMARALPDQTDAAVTDWCSRALTSVLGG